MQRNTIAITVLLAIVFFIGVFFIGACTGTPKPGPEAGLAYANAVTVSFDDKEQKVFSFEGLTAQIPVPKGTKKIKLQIKNLLLAIFKITGDDLVALSGHAVRMAEGQFKVFTLTRHRYIVALNNDTVRVQDYKNHHRFDVCAHCPKWVNVVSAAGSEQGPFEGFIFRSKIPKKIFRVEIDGFFLGNFLWRGDFLKVINAPYERWGQSDVLVDHFGEKYVVATTDELTVINFKNCPEGAGAGTWLYKKYSSWSRVDIVCIADQDLKIRRQKSNEILKLLAQNGWHHASDQIKDGLRQRLEANAIRILVYTDGFIRIVRNCSVVFEGTEAEKAVSALEAQFG